MPLIGHKIETTNDNFGGLVRKNCLLVDKTLMIKEFMDGQDVSLIVRPRRFGKTINLSMLQHFLSSHVNGEPTENLFKDLLISQVDDGKFLLEHQGQYPVIFITFKDLQESSYDAAINKIRILIQNLYADHKFLLQKHNIDSDNLIKFQKYLNGDVNPQEISASLVFLSQFLYTAYEKKKVIILIDEYDTPLTSAYQGDFLDPLSNFMRDMFGFVLKGNPYLEKGLMTGILRVSKSSMLSGLNNLEVYTLLEQKYASYFGFTEDEVNELLLYTHNTVVHNRIKNYYNGYNIGGSVIYNPWSTMKFLDRGELIPYWVFTSNDRILSETFLNSNEQIKTQLGDLIQGKSIIGKVNINLRYDDLISNQDSLWTLLLFCGYLTIENKKYDDLQIICQLKIPNREVLAQYSGIFKNWLEKTLGGTRYTSLLSSLVTGDVPVFTESLGQYLIESLSVHDVHGKKTEKFYHGFVTGLIASVRDTHWIDSNKESGLGRYDVILIPKDPNTSIGIVIEFKQTEKQNTLKQAAEQALQQINAMQYDTILKRSPHIKHVIKIGLAFCNKAVMSAYQHEKLSVNQLSEIKFCQIYAAQYI